MIKKHRATKISYTKGVGGSGDLKRFDSSDRVVIPTSLPSYNMKALDVTGLSEAEVHKLEEQIAEYAAYQKAVVNTIFSFEDWLGHSYGEDADENVKWRTFNIDGVAER